jgi:hypothetical protein
MRSCDWQPHEKGITKYGAESSGDHRSVRGVILNDGIVLHRQTTQRNALLLAVRGPGPVNVPQNARAKQIFSYWTRLGGITPLEQRKEEIAPVHDGVGRFGLECNENRCVVLRRTIMPGSVIRGSRFIGAGADPLRPRGR